VIENFLRPPRGAGEWLADLLRVVGAASVLVAFLWWEPTDGGVVAAAVPAMLAPRFAGVRAGFDIAYGAVVLIAAWSNVLDLYRTLPSWDLVVHFAATGLIAAVLFVLLCRAEVIASARARRVRLVMIPLLGLAVSALWEIVEWAGKTFVTDTIFVTYQDTIGDIAFGGLGSIAVALLVTAMPIERPVAHLEEKENAWPRN